MAFPKAFARNPELDALLVHGAMRGLFVPAAIAAGMTPDQAFGRAEWLKKQPAGYRDEVVSAVLQLEAHPGD